MYVCPRHLGVDCIRSDPSYDQRAAEIAVRLSHEDGVRNASDAIEKQL
jgi:hypothetical protein